MKRISFLICFTLLAGLLSAQGQKTVKLNPPDLTRGYPVMKALSLRASDSQFDTAPLKLQDLSDLLWAANGINRPAIGKRTAPSAMNAQDIDIYVFLESGAYLYNAKEHALDLIAEGDNRNLFAGRQEKSSPSTICLLVSDISRFRFGTDSLKLVWAAEDAGIVSQNISIFCASVGLATRPRAGMNQQKLKDLLKLRSSQYLMLNHPVSYKREGK
ncbi:MAG: SagB/ThcOx family dehydrogenase [Bacteroidota bacterium]|nr:SagB/ThcOx family dehydrogenase [Bacteroidota bacterium]MDP4225708.1 SagB/ThcOx family dehydrogenase [Bacteroidota bacterium]